MVHHRAVRIATAQASAEWLVVVCAVAALTGSLVVAAPALGKLLTGNVERTICTITAF